MVLVYALVAAGVGLTLVRLMMLMFLRVNIKLLNVQLLKLIHANNIDRAVKLCSAMPTSPYCNAIKMTLQRYQKMDSPVTDRIEEQQLREGFQTDFDAALKKMRSNDWIASLGVLLAVTGAAISLGMEDANPAPVAGPIVALALAFNSRRTVNTTRDQGRSHGEKVIDVLIGNAKGS